MGGGLSDRQMIARSRSMRGTSRLVSVIEQGMRSLTRRWQGLEQSVGEMNRQRFEQRMWVSMIIPVRKGVPTTKLISEKKAGHMDSRFALI